MFSIYRNDVICGLILKLILLILLLLIWGRKMRLIGSFYIYIYISSGGRAAGGVPKPPPRRSQRLPRGLKDVPREAQDPHRGSQDILKTLPKLPRLVFSFPDLPRAQIDQNGPKWLSQTMCFTMSGLNFWTTLRYFVFQNVFTTTF